MTTWPAPVHGYDPRADGAECASCPLGPNGFLFTEKWGWAPVPTEHRAVATIALAENPSEMERTKGYPFAGPSGVWWERGINALRKARTSYAIGNVIACQCPGEPTGAYERMTHNVAAMNKRLLAKGEAEGIPASQVPTWKHPAACCRPRLMKDIAPYRNVVTLGGTAVKELLGGTSGILSIHGSPMELPSSHGASRKVLPTFHPAFVSRAPQWFRDWVVDLARGERYFADALTWRDPAILWQPTPDQLAAWLAEPPPTARTVSDVETSSTEPLRTTLNCLGMAKRCVEPIHATCFVCGGSGKDPTGAPGPHNDGRCETCLGAGQWVTKTRAVLIPWIARADGLTHAYSQADQRAIFELLAAHWEDPGHWKMGHNFVPFDMLVLREWGFRVLGRRPRIWPVYDTLVPAKLATPDLPKGLAVMGQRYTDVHAWKNDNTGKKIAWNATGPLQLGVYCLYESVPVVLADGSTRTIGEIVRKRQAVDVLSLVNGKLAARPVIGWHRNTCKGQKWVSIKTSVPGKRESQRRGIVLTPDHRVLTQRGWIEAQDVVVGDRVAAPEMALSHSAIGAIIGTLLGDSSAVPSNRKGNWHSAKAAILAGGHAQPAGISEAKARVLPFLRVAAPRANSPIQGYQAAPFVRYHSPMLVQLARLLPMIYTETGKKRITREALDLLGGAGLAWWILDDGTVVQGSRRNGARSKARCSIRLCTQGFDAESIQCAAAWIRERFGACSVTRVGGILIAPRAARAICALAARFMPPEGRYKLIPGYTWDAYDPSALQSTGEPVWVDVVHVATYQPKNWNRDTRYCISVAESACFFTPWGLVANCTRDCAVNDEAADPLIADAVARGMREPLRDDLKPTTWPAAFPWTLEGVDHRTLFMCTGLHENGMFIDQERRRAHADKLVTEKAVRRAECMAFAERAGLPSTWNPGSPEQVIDLLYDKWRWPVIKRSKQTDLPSTDDACLREHIVDKNLPEDQRKFASAIRLFRRAGKAKSTFVDVIAPETVQIGKEKFGIAWASDGRVHSKWNQLPGVGRLNSSDNNCFDGLTEVLTPDGWVAFPQLRQGQRVAQWRDGLVEFVVPTAYVEREHHGDMVHVQNEHIDLLMTPDHRCLLRRWDTQEARVVSAVDYPDQGYHQLHGGQFNDGTVSVSVAMIVLLCAVQADGHITKDGAIDFGFKKARKVARLTWALRTLNVEYRDYSTTRRSRLFIPVNAVPAEVKAWLGTEKHFGPWLLSWTAEARKLFSEEVFFWDGRAPTRAKLGNTYSSNERVNAEWVQTVHALLGHRASISSVMTTAGNTNWQVNVTRRDYSWTTNRRKRIGKASTTVYCVSVPSSFLLVRRRDCIMVTGNCQNVPKKFRDQYVPAPGHVYVSADMDQLHLRIIANKWRIKALLAGFLEGIDPHCSLAYAFFPKEFPIVDGWGEKGFSLKRKPKKDSDADKIRNQAKVIRYQGAYADIPLGIHRSVTKVENKKGELIYANVSVSQVQAWYDIWMDAEPDWQTAWDMEMSAFRRNGGWIGDGLFGRRSGALEGGKKQAVVNWPILATEPCIMRIAESNVLAAFPFGFAGPGTGMVNQCHDAITLEVPGACWDEPAGRTDQGPEVYWKKLDAERILCWDARAERARRTLEECMNVVVPGWPVPFTCEADVGRSWAEA